MQDSTITYKVVTTGIEEAEAKFNSLGATAKRLTVSQNGTVTATGELTREQANLATATGSAEKATTKASKAHESYAVHIAKTTIQSALVNKAFLGLTSAAGDAVKQVDLFSTFPASMAALGLSSRDASASLVKLRDYSAQTGVNLATATQSVARFAEITKNVKAATVEFIGVNNALIAGGAGAEVQKNAMEQLIQAYSRGKPQLIEWRSLMVAMPAQLNQVAQAMKLPNAQALGESLTKGKVSMQDFMTKLTEMSTGTGAIAKQMRARMTGIEFASNQMRAALTNGIAAIIQAIGRENIVSFFTFMTQVIYATSRAVVILINDLISLFNFISKVFGGPQIKHFNAQTGAAAGNLQDGAQSAQDLGDGMGDAADNAKELNKSLASFDKMNVLDKGKPAKDTGGGAQNGLDPGTAAEMNDLFDKLGGGLKEASKWAKILAGILLGLAGNALINKLFGVNPLKELIKGIGDAAKGFAGLGKEAENAGDKTGKSFATKFGESASKGVGKLGSVIAGAAGGIAGVVTETIGPALLGAFVSVFADLGVAIAAAFGVEIAVGVGAALLAFGVILLVIAAIAAVVWLIWTNWDTIWKYIKIAFDAVVSAIVAVWQTLYDIFAAPVKFIWQFITAIFILIVAIIATALELIFKLVVGTIYVIYLVLAAIAGWINDNVIQPVWHFFQWLWDTITSAVVAAWQWIFTNVLKPIGTWIYNNVIVPVVNFFTGLWNSITGIFKSIFSSIGSVLSPIANWINDHVIQPVFNFFQGLWDRILQGLKNMWEGLKNVFGSLGGIIKAPINGVITLINDVLRSMNKIKVPDWVPGLGGKGVNFPMIPTLAKGGVVEQATMAVIGENGAEAVMPLENNTGWIDTLASKINDKNGGGQPIQLVVQIGEDKLASKVIDLINEKTQMSGRNTIYV